jgi:uncharacterized repeat protein (TIGR01451 family)/CSLREA domain-containing protein
MRHGCTGVLICVLFARLTSAPAVAGAAPSLGHSYLVNSTLDEPDADPANGVCSSTPSGQCTLRAAIMESSFAAGPNTITLPAGTYVIDRPGYDNNSLLGDYDIGHDLTLQGAGPGATIVDGNGATTADRVFKILNTAQNVTLAGITIRNGQSLSSTAGVIGGGGLYVEGAVHLTLNDVILEGNTAQNGGGVYANFSSQGGSIDLEHVSLRANMALAGGVGVGGGLFAQLSSALSHVVVQDSQVYSNTADGTGGGFFLDGNQQASWQIERSQIYSNTASSGGGTGNFVPLDAVDTRMHDNHATFDGGAIEAFSPYTLTRAIVDANSTGRFGGAIFDLGTSAVNGTFANIAQSTFSGNFSVYGGAIYHDGFITPSSLLRLTNSTLSGNTASRNGGGVYVFGGLTELFNTTIANNRVRFHVGQPGIGGGLYVTATAVLTAENSVIANNTRGNGIMLETRDDCFSSGTVGTLAYDLILTTTNCFVTGPQGGLIVGQDPLLGPLQDNGGSTQTHALLTGSPAINAGAPAGCTGGGGAPITIDQRGALRNDVRCDIGAYEVVPEADVSVSQADSPDPVRVGAPLIYTLAVTNNGPAPASGIFLTDTLPVAVSFHSASSTQGSCVGTVTIACALGSLASGASLTVTVAVTPTTPGLITNMVAVSGNPFDPAAANNSTSETTNVVVVHELDLPLVLR